MEENWVKIYEVEDYKKTNKPIWLEQILIDNNIPYNNEIEVKKYNKIRKIGFMLWIGFLFIIIIFGIIGTIMTNI